MNVDEKNALRDKLIARKNGTIKYGTMLADCMRGLGELGAYKDGSLDEIEAAAIAFSDAAYQRAIEALRSELTNDPDQLGYAGKTPEQIQELIGAVGFWNGIPYCRNKPTLDNITEAM